MEDTQEIQVYKKTKNGGYKLAYIIPESPQARRLKEKKKYENILDNYLNYPENIKDASK